MVRSRLGLAACLGLVLLVLPACDPNPGGPEAPTQPAPGAADAQATTAPGVMPKSRGKSAPAPPAPVSAQ